MLQDAALAQHHRAADDGDDRARREALAAELVHLVEWLREENYLLLDTQWMTDHLRQFGGEEVTREDYFKYLDEALEGIYEDPVQNLQDARARRRGAARLLPVP